MMTPPKEHEHTETGWGALTGTVSLIALVLTLLVMTFAWPGSRAQPAGMTVAVTGSPELVAGFTAAAGEGLSAIVELDEVENREAAVSGIAERLYIGGIVLEQEAPEVLTAAAAGQVPAGVMTGIVSQLQGVLDAQIYGALRGVVERVPDAGSVASQLPEQLPAVVVTDLAPYSEGDPSGAGITAAGIPLTVGALLAGIMIALTVRGRPQRIVAVLGLGIGGGLLLALVMATWLGVTPAPFGTVWLLTGLSLAATSALFVGLHAALGRIGIGVAGGLTLFAAMPWASFAVPYTFLPAGLGYIGQWLIPGATATLARTVSYFPDAASAAQWWIMAAWLILGVGLACVARGGAGQNPAPRAPSIVA